MRDALGLVMNIMPIVGNVQPTRFTSIPVQVNISNVDGGESVALERWNNRTNCSIALWPVIWRAEAHFMMLPNYTAGGDPQPLDIIAGNQPGFQVCDDHNVTIPPGGTITGTMDVPAVEAFGELEEDKGYDVIIFADWDRTNGSLLDDEGRDELRYNRGTTALQNVGESNSEVVFMEGVAVYGRLDRILDWTLKMDRAEDGAE